MLNSAVQKTNSSDPPVTVGFQLSPTKLFRFTVGLVNADYLVIFKTLPPLVPT